VSNHVPELDQLVADLGLRSFFDGVVSSGVVGYEKPHQRLFAHAMESTGAARPIWMIGDNVDADCIPVRALGHEAVLVRSARAGAFRHQASGLMAALEIIESTASAS
jgi:putative hydrolase of the HAD superfamily